MAKRGKGNDNSRRRGAPTKSLRPASDPAPDSDSEGSTIEVKHPPRKPRPQHTEPAQTRDQTTHEEKDGHERDESRGGMPVEQRVEEFVPAWAQVASQAEGVDMKYILHHSDDGESDHHLYYQVDAGDEADRADDPAPAKQAKACLSPEMATHTFSTLHLSIAEFLMYAHVQRLIAGVIVVRPVEAVDSVTGEVRVPKPPCAETMQCNAATDLVKLKEYVSGNVYEVKAHMSPPAPMTIAPSSLRAWHSDVSPPAPHSNPKVQAQFLSTTTTRPPPSHTTPTATRISCDMLVLFLETRT